MELCLEKMKAALQPASSLQIKLPRHICLTANLLLPSAPHLSATGTPHEEGNRSCRSFWRQPGNMWNWVKDHIDCMLAAGERKWPCWFKGKEEDGTGTSEVRLFWCLRDELWHIFQIGSDSASVWQARLHFVIPDETLRNLTKLHLCKYQRFTFFLSFLLFFFF